MEFSIQIHNDKSEHPKETQSAKFHTSLLSTLKDVGSD